ncbi:class I SAM-dependent RNA methyltransferase [Oceaniglobus indicus]|uniref:class I SAM-dependent RNA methyltransferase n=1 Tax=Oceaniglobus indicus TaxID=2047749 RepID=UPI000C198BAE|nr:class I SAM-dependent RNA methyltransferase [Oceaniglobus indicus]
MTHTIERLGHHGDGIAAGPIFVARTLPGEVITGEVTGNRITAPRIVTPSANRVTPPCRHYNTCGGCALQHASDAFVADWKVGVVVSALAAQGITAPINGPATSPPNSRRRATLSARRTKKGAMVGFHGRASDTISAIDDCHLLHPAIMAGLPACEALTVAGASRKGELALTVTASESGLDIAALGGKDLDQPLRTTLAGIADRHDLARLTWEDELIAGARPPVQSFGAAKVAPPPGAFLQATAHGQQALTEAVIRAVGPAKQVIDLFAGSGTFALPLARTAEVHAVEGERAMMDALDQGWRGATGLKRVSCETRDLFRRPMLPDELNRYAAIVIDPPRAGAEAQTAEIARSTVPVVAAVSCNPTTFARDAKLLCDAGFTLDWVAVVDQFRWSPHVEVAARFSRKHVTNRQHGKNA